MEETQLIELQRKRDFSEKLNVTFAFTIQNFKSFMKSLLFIAAPPVLVASLLMSSFMADFMKLIFGAAGNPQALLSYFATPNFWLQISVMSVFLMVSYVAVIATTNNYLILYNEKKSTHIEVSEVWARVRETLGMYVVTTLLFVFLSIGAYLLVLIPVVVLRAISGFLVVLGVMAYFFALVYVFVAASLVYPIRAFEKKGFFESIRRSLHLIRGKWWSTFGLTIIITIIISIIAYIFSIPASIIQGVSMAHDVQGGSLQTAGDSTSTIVFLLNSLAYISQLLLYFLLNLALAFQYFNLVELKESKGLLSKIETLGNAAPPPPSEEHY